MSATAASIRQGTRRGFALDPLLIGLLLSLLLLGLVMVTSASISLSSQGGGDPFAYLKNQLATAAGGVLLAMVLCCVPTDLLQKHANMLLIIAGVLLVAVLVPGIGHEVK